MAYDAGELALQTEITLRLRRDRAAGGVAAARGLGARATPLIAARRRSGRALFNEALPADYPFVNEDVDKKRLGALVNDLAERYSKTNVAATLDELKDLGFRWATRSGVTISFDDVVAPPKKAELLEEAEKRAAAVQDQYDDGLITDAERRQELIEIWTRTTDEVAEAMKENFPATNPVFMMVNSGARGNWMQVRQIAGMRGLVANPKGEIIPRPIKSNYREGLSVLEYFIATHGARKGLADTALRTADSGYLTRRLVDVSQDVIIREEDCGTERGLQDGRSASAARTASSRPTSNVDTSAVSRILSEDVDRRRRGAGQQGRGAVDHPGRAAVRRRRRRGPAALGAHLRLQGRHVRHVLRPFAGDRQAGRRRRGHRHHRRPVHRRARHAADDAHVPHRRRGR